MLIHAVLFDFDGILVDTEWSIYQAWKRTFEAHQHDLPLEVYTRCIGSDFATWSPKIHLEELTGQSFDWHDLDQRRQQEILNDLEGVGPMEGAVALIDQLEERQIRMAVVSSSSHEWVGKWLRAIGLFERFETIVCRDDVERIKPAPDLFLEALRQLQIEASEALVIEDSHNGVLAAAAAGVPVWAVPNRVTSGSDFSKAGREFTSLVPLAAALTSELDRQGPRGD